MNPDKTRTGPPLATGFRAGAAVISRISTTLILIHRNQFLYNGDILAIPVAVLIIYAGPGRRLAGN
jgi:hypothetical protein